MASYEPATTGNAVAETLKDTVKTTPVKSAKFSKNQIHFVADNQTSFSLTPNPTTFLDEGYFASDPATVGFFPCQEADGRNFPWVDIKLGRTFH